VCVRERERGRQKKKGKGRKKKKEKRRTPFLLQRPAQLLVFVGIWPSSETRLGTVHKPVGE